MNLDECAKILLSVDPQASLTVQLGVDQGEKGPRHSVTIAILNTREIGYGYEVEAALQACCKNLVSGLDAAIAACDASAKRMDSIKAAQAAFGA